VLPYHEHPRTRGVEAHAVVGGYDRDLPYYGEQAILVTGDTPVLARRCKAR
jgi:hypothetical protein